MRKQLFITAVLLLALAAHAYAQMPGTEGKDFWVTFLRSDITGDENNLRLELTVSAKEQCSVTFENPYTQQKYTQSVNAGEAFTYPLYTSTPRNTNNDRWGCYTIQPEQVLQTAIHVTADANISLYASNWKNKSFDATNVLPVTALYDHYLIQTYPGSDHEDKPQGSHFAIIAAEDNTVVDIDLSVATSTGKTGRITTPTLQKGQVYYVWAGNKSGDESDLSGTEVTARNGKPIAVFQGCPHTNIPNKIRDRDHIYSQAIPTAFWGTRFAVTLSATRKRDKIRIMAINDGTEVKINGQVVHYFDFANDNVASGAQVTECYPKGKRTYEFEIGEKNVQCTDSKQSFALQDPKVTGESCFIETSCPCAVHLLMTSNKYDDTPYGDPSMLPINPIEQGINQVTFSTYGANNHHFANIVTETVNIPYMQLVRKNASNAQETVDLATLGKFKPVAGCDEKYSYIRLDSTLLDKVATYTLKGRFPFSAHVYGYGQRESYGYSVGSAAVQKGILFNGMNALDGSQVTNVVCVNDSIDLESHFSVDVDKVMWDLGDGVTKEMSGDERFRYIYESEGWYDVKAVTSTTNPCDGSSYKDTISVSVYVSKPDTMYHQFAICEGEQFEYGGKTYTESVTDTTTFNCDSIVVFTVQVGKKQTVQLADTTVNDSVWWDGRFEYGSNGETRTLTDTLRTWFFRCDSIVSRDVTFRSCLRIRVQTGNLQVCSLEPVSIPYVVEKGGISDATLEVNGQTLPLTWDGQFFHCETGLPKAGTYSATLRVTDAETACNQVIPFTFDVTALFPKTVFQQKWNDVLAVLNAKYNGGYTFTAYQWLKNGQPIEGATGSWYQVPEGLDAADEYSVLLTTADGLTLPSCPRHGGDKTGGNGDGNNGSNGDGNGGIDVNPGGILPGGGMIFIRAKGQGTASLYSTMGQPEGSISFTNEGSIRMPERSGIYVLDIRMADGTKKSVHVMVQ